MLDVQMVRSAPVKFFRSLMNQELFRKAV